MRILSCLLMVLVALLLSPALAGAKRNVYVGNNTVPGTVTAYDIAAGSGALAPIPGSPFPTSGNGARAVAISPGGTFLFAANVSTNRVSAFGIAAASGALGAVPGSPFASGANPLGLATSPNGKYLYSSNSANVTAFSIDQTSGQLTSMGTVSPGDSPFGIAVTPDGKYLYVADIGGVPRLFGFGINQSTGALTPLSPSNFTVTGGSPYGVTIAPDGKYLYTANRIAGTVSILSIGADGQLASAGTDVTVGLGIQPEGVAVAPDGKHLYTADANATDVFAFGINPLTGGLTPVGSASAGAGSHPAGISLTPDGKRLYTSNSSSSKVSAFDVNQSSGALTATSESPFSGVSTPEFQSLAITPNAGPTAAFTISAASPGQSTGFDASTSTDPDSAIAKYDWDFGDGTTLTDGGAAPSHTYATAGTYSATLTVANNDGCSTAVVFTGQTAYCNGSSKAQQTQQVAISESQGDPSPGAAAKPVIRLSGVPSRCARRDFRVRVRVSSSSTIERAKLILLRQRRAGHGKKKLRAVKTLKRTRSSNFRVKVAARKLKRGRYAVRANAENSSGTSEKTSAFRRC